MNARQVIDSGWGSAGDRSDVGPTALRMALGGQLRRLREAQGISRDKAAATIRASQAKISRLEGGRVSFKARDLGDLLTLYGADESERARVLSLSEQANAPGWWERYGDVLPGWLETYVGLEHAASAVRTYQSQLVPGLLQTEDYARAVATLGDPTASSEDIERRVELRLARQRAFFHVERKVALWVAVDEAALRRPVGGTRVHRDQVRHLIELADRSEVTLQVVPFDIGGHPAAGGAFTILRFPETGLPDVVYLEQLTSALYLDRPDDTDHYLAVMDRLCTGAFSPDHSIAALRMLA